MKYGIATLTVLTFLLSGCDQPTVTDTATQKEVQTAQAAKQTYVAPPAKKEITLKDVNDTNFDAAYMYPGESKKKETVAAVQQKTASTQGTMDKAQCIDMITEEKFNKYAAMFGSEEASIKRCQMLKAASL